MTRPLTTELIRTRTKTDSLQYVKRFTLCGNDIDDVKLVRQMPNIEVLSLSVNRINTLKDFAHCHKLQELYVRKNSILELSEVQYLADLPDLKVLWLCENPCADSQYYREYVIAMLPNLENLDKTPITQEERNAASNMNFEQPESRNGAKQSESPLNRPSYKDRVENGDKYNGERNGAPSNYNRYNEASSQAYDDGNNYQRNGNGDVRRPSYRNTDSPVEDYTKGTPNTNTRNKNSPPSLKNENVITAILTLLKDLDDSGLKVIKKDIEKRLIGQ